MPTYRVTSTIVSGNIDSEPVSVDWYTGTDLAQAMHAMTGAACHGRNEDRDSFLPESMRFRVLNVHLSIEH